MNLKRSFNAPYQYFYPINSSADVGQIYSGKFNPPVDSYALHFFGGHPLTQKFNQQYDEDFAKKSMDTISVLARKIGIL
jgi:hypothetical protein